MLLSSQLQAGLLEQFLSKVLREARQVRSWSLILVQVPKSSGFFRFAGRIPKFPYWTWAAVALMHCTLQCGYPFRGHGGFRAAVLDTSFGGAPSKLMQSAKPLRQRGRLEEARQLRPAGEDFIPFLGAPLTTTDALHAMPLPDSGLSPNCRLSAALGGVEYRSVNIFVSGLG